MDPTTGALIGAIVTALALLAYNYHKPRVDYAKTGNDALVAAIAEMRRERDDDRQQIEALKARVTAAEADATQARCDSVAARREATEARRMNTHAVAENARLVDYLLLITQAAVDGHMPPFADPIDHGLGDRLTYKDVNPPPQTANQE